MPAAARDQELPEKNLLADVDAMLAAVGPQARLPGQSEQPTGALLPQSEVRRLRGAAR